MTVFLCVSMLLQARLAFWLTLLFKDAVIVITTKYGGG